MSRILLINPPSGFLADQRVFLPLGIAYIASVARETGHTVRLLDLAGSDDYVGESMNALRTAEYDAIGLTATSPQFSYAYQILQGIKQSGTNIQMIIGGSHASMFSTLRNQLIQRFSSEGITGEDLVERIYNEDPNFSSLEEFDTIASGEEGSLERALNSEGVRWVDGGITTDLDSIPFPARDLFDFNSYLRDPQGSPKFVIDGRPSGSVISQRGCPYKCEFCCGRDTEMYHTVRIKDRGGNTVWRAPSPERILQELDEMHERFGLSSFMFYDDELNLNPHRTKELFARLSKRNYKFRGFVKSDLLVRNPEIASAMHNVGFVDVLTGIESGSDRILGRHLHKGTSPELNYRAAMICLETGLAFKALAMVGHTSETEADILKTRDWLLKVGKKFVDKLGPNYFTFDLTIFQPYAGSPIWDNARKNDDAFSDEFGWVYFTKNSRGEVIDPEQGGLYFNKADFSREQAFYKGVPGEYKSFVRTRGISPERYVALRDFIDTEIRNELGLARVGRK